MRKHCKLNLIYSTKQFLSRCNTENSLHNLKWTSAACLAYRLLTLMSIEDIYGKKAAYCAIQRADDRIKYQPQKKYERSPGYLQRKFQDDPDAAPHEDKNIPDCIEDDQYRRSSGKISADSYCRNHKQTGCGSNQCEYSQFTDIMLECCSHTKSGQRDFFFFLNSENSLLVMLSLIYLSPSGSYASDAMDTRSPTAVRQAIMLLPP